MDKLTIGKNLMQSAKFISFEGTEGVGKTTAIASLCTKLESSGIDYIRTREPGGSEFAERLRALLIDPDNAITADTELLLMFAARSDHLARTIIPALDAGKWVVCDRFIDSSFAYQGFGRRHGDKDVLTRINSLVAQFVVRLPDLSIWLDLPVQEGMRRAGKRGNADRFEQEDIDFFDRVYQGFAYQHQHHPNRIKRVDASGEVSEVADRIWTVLQELI